MRCVFNSRGNNRQNNNGKSGFCVNSAEIDELMPEASTTSAPPPRPPRDNWPVLRFPQWCARHRKPCVYPGLLFAVFSQLALRLARTSKQMQLRSSGHNFSCLYMNLKAEKLHKSHLGDESPPSSGERSAVVSPKKKRRRTDTGQVVKRLSVPKICFSL